MWILSTVGRHTGYRRPGSVLSFFIITQTTRNYYFFFTITSCFLRIRRDTPPVLWGRGRNAGKSAETCGRGFKKSWAGLARPECRTADKTCSPRTRTSPGSEDTQAVHAGPPGYAVDLCCRGRNAGKSARTHCRGFIKSWTGFARPERWKISGDVRPGFHKTMGWLARPECRTAEKTCSPRMHTAPEGEHADGTCGTAGICRMGCGDADGTPKKQRGHAAGVS